MPGDLYTTAWACGCVLADGEPADSPRAVAQAGPRAAVLLHRAADLDMEGWQNTSPVPPSVQEQVDGYVAMARGFEPPDARYLNNHRGHFVFVKPEERKFVTAELIRRTTFTATEQELKQRVEALRERRLEPNCHPDHPRRGAGNRGLGAHQARLRLKYVKEFPARLVALHSGRNQAYRGIWTAAEDIGDTTNLRPPRNDRQRPSRRRGFDDDNFYGNAPPPPMPFPSFASSAPEVEATVKWFNAEKGYGFVALTDGSGDVFLHVNTLQGAGYQTVSPGATLRIRVGQGQKGRQVDQVTSVDESTATAAAPGGGRRPGGAVVTSSARRAASKVRRGGRSISARRSR